MIVFSVYISPNTTIRQSKTFLTRHLFAYKYKDTPIVVTGDFNINILIEENADIVKFMKDWLNLDLISDPKQPTTLGGSCIDLVFARNTPKLPSKRFVSYFSYHRPLFTLLTTLNQNTANSTLTD